MGSAPRPPLPQTPNFSLSARAETQNNPSSGLAILCLKQPATCSLVETWFKALFCPESGAVVFCPSFPRLVFGAKHRFGANLVLQSLASDPSRAKHRGNNLC